MASSDSEIVYTETTRLLCHEHGESESINDWEFRLAFKAGRAFANNDTAIAVEWSTAVSFPNSAIFDGWLLNLLCRPFV